LKLYSQKNNKLLAELLTTEVEFAMESICANFFERTFKAAEKAGNK